MKATTWIIGVILVILAIIFGAMWINASNKAKGLEKTRAELQQLYDDSSLTINEIQGSLDALDREILGTIGRDSELPAGTPEERRASIINSIANARTKIEEYKDQIKSLESRLASSSGQLSGLQSIVNRLKASVSEKERIVSELEGRVADLSTTLETERQTAQAEINLRESMLKEKDNVITNQSIENNQLYYAVGTRRELLDNGIIDRKGGILGIGRVSTVTRNVQLAKYTAFNLLDTQELTFPATKKGYAILSNHVAASYEVNKVGDEYVLTVTDPELFRKQKVLVIELK
ncbi:MAG: hypothetical protein K0B87_04835 [Candidatus Syntrophosphaera sp.]|nr:hypothetical protein [Candidatus Syntrophosphaera sp.]